MSRCFITQGNNGQEKCKTIVQSSRPAGLTRRKELVWRDSCQQDTTDGWTNPSILWRNLWYKYIKQSQCSWVCSTNSVFDIYFIYALSPKYLKFSIVNAVNASKTEGHGQSARKQIWLLLVIVSFNVISRTRDTKNWINMSNAWIQWTPQ